jgi:hypothetical protein
VGVQKVSLKILQLKGNSRVLYPDSVKVVLMMKEERNE